MSISDQIVMEILQDHLEKVINELYKHICPHEETHRGGAIWEICNDCGCKWADDEGGKPEFKYPKAMVDAEEFLFKSRGWKI